MFKTIGNPLVEFFQDYVWAPGLRLMPHWGPVGELILLLILLGGTVAAIGWIVHRLHRSSVVACVTTPYTRRWVICGAAFAILSLINPKGDWVAPCHVAYLLLFGGVALFVAKACHDAGVTAKDRWSYAGRAAAYGLAFFALGFVGALICAVAFVIVIALIVVAAIALGNMSPERRANIWHKSGFDRSVVSLTDGTEIERVSGNTWRDTGFSGREYTRNYDGTFTQTK